MRKVYQNDTSHHLTCWHIFFKNFWKQILPKKVNVNKISLAFSSIQIVHYHTQPLTIHYLAHFSNHHPFPTINFPHPPFLTSHNELVTTSPTSPPTPRATSSLAHSIIRGVIESHNQDIGRYIAIGLIDPSWILVYYKF